MCQWGRTEPSVVGGGGALLGVRLELGARQGRGLGPVAAHAAAGVGAALPKRGVAGLAGLGLGGGRAVEEPWEPRRRQGPGRRE